MPLDLPPTPSSSPAPAPSARTSTHPPFNFSPLRQRLAIPLEWSDPLLPFLPDKLPLLPPIREPALARQAGLHLSLPLLLSSSDPAMRSRYKRELASYEPLEGAGDRFLTDVVYRFVKRSFPNLTASPVGDLQSRLVRNQTLAYLSRHYGLAKDLSADPSLHLQDDMDVAANLFEAHVGGLLEDGGEEGERSVRRWLEDVFCPAAWPTLSLLALELEQKISYYKDLPVSRDAEQKWSCVRCEAGLGSSAPPLSFVYDTHDQRKGWHVRMYAGGILMGCGCSARKGEAEKRALYGYLNGVRV